MVVFLSNTCSSLPMRTVMRLFWLVSAYCPINWLGEKPGGKLKVEGTGDWLIRLPNVLPIPKVTSAELPLPNCNEPTSRPLPKITGGGGASIPCISSTEPICPLPRVVNPPMEPPGIAENDGLQLGILRRLNSKAEGFTVASDCRITEPTE